MNIRKKTPAELEHQVADYLLHGTAHSDRMRATHLGRMTQLLLEATPETLGSNRAVYEHNPLVRGEDLEEFAGKYPEHLRSRSKDPRSREFYKQKAAAVERYNEEFAPLVDAINLYEKSDMISGSYATPYLIESDGQPYVARLIKPKEGMDHVEKHIDAALRVPDIDHLEHVVAVSYKDCVTVAPLLLGKSFKQLRFTDNAQRITATQLRELYNAMKQGNERGVGFDGIGGNILYDPDHGFSVIDMEPLHKRGSASTALLAQLQYLVADTTNSRDFSYVDQIERIVGNVEAIFASDPEAKDELDRLRTLRRMIQMQSGDMVDTYAPLGSYGDSRDSFW